MTFPPSERVEYENNPLREVVCELRFPRILRLDSEVPVRLHERLAPEYPEYSFRRSVDLGEEQSVALPSLLANPPTRPLYSLASRDAEWRVSLASGSIALSWYRYRRWDDFRPRLLRVRDAFVAEYAPPYLTRIGLRYVNLIRRSDLGLTQSRWSDLLASHVIGELARTEVEGAVRHARRELVLQLGTSGALVRVVHGLLWTKEKPADEACYAIDSDFYTENRTEIADSERLINAFNQEAGRVFRWSISEKLHLALKPRPIPGGRQ